MGRQTADLLFSNARVWAGRGSSVDAPELSIAIGGRRVLAIGTREEMAGWCDGETRLIDIGGRRVIPGLIDSHIHAIRAGLTYLDELDWTEVRSLADALASIRRAAESRPSGSWITVLGGWHPSQLNENRMPTTAELDAVAPHHSVFVHPLYGHDDVAVLNSGGLEDLDWANRGEDPQGVTLLRDERGVPDGRVIGLSAYQAVALRAFTRDAARESESSTAFFQHLASFGLTGVIDAAGLGMDPSKYRAVRDIWRLGNLPIRVRMNLGAVTRGAEADEVGRWSQYMAPELGDDMLSVLGLGEVVHFGCHDWEGMHPLDIAEHDYLQLVDTIRDIAVAGWPLTLHAILDSSITRILDAISEVAADIDVAPLRWSLCHVECISSNNLDRVKHLGLGLTLQSRMVHKSKICASRWGEAALRTAPPLGDVVNRGIPFGGGTDATRSASYNPWQALWWFVTGQNVDGGPERDRAHRLDRATALDAYTRGSAWFSFEENIRGVLTAGAHADLAVLSDDYFTVADDAIPAITSELTLVAGAVVHRSDAFGHLPLERHGGTPSRGAAGRPSPAGVSR